MKDVELMDRGELKDEVRRLRGLLNLQQRPHLTEEQLRDVYEGARKTGPRLGEVFKHLKTRNLYTVQGVALEKETLTPVVVYRRGYHEGAGHPTFTCPLSIWTPDRYAPVDREGDGL